MFLLAAILSAWTNTAGHVISAEPLRIEGASVVMDCGSRGVRKLPLSVFPAGERSRLGAALGRHGLPEKLRELRMTLAAELTRAEQRRAGGALDDGAFEAKRTRLFAAWAKALAEAKLSAEETEFWKGRLK